jgi:two-component system, chemotaxis family, sensor kinase CheA
MPKRAKPAKQALDLRQQVERLALRIVLADGEPVASYAEALAEIAKQANAEKLAGVADLAAKMRKSIETGSAPIEELQKGITLMQQSIQDLDWKGEAAPALSEAAVETLSVTEPTQVRPAAAGAAQHQASGVAASLLQDKELVGGFIQESREHLVAIERELLTVEKDPANQAAIHGVFRAFHTIKGLAGFLDLAPLREVAHEVETVLDLARNGKLAVRPEVIDVVLAAADYLKAGVAVVEAALQGNGGQTFGLYDDLLERVRALMQEDPMEAASPAAATPSGAAGPAQPAAKSQAGDSGSVRVETGKLDYLMDMVGEMVIAQSLIRHNKALSITEDPHLLSQLSQLSRITGEVQRTTMSMRMVPVAQVFQRTARVVRDLARKAEKQVELATSGEDTELDKTIAEELHDPLMHMVRNAMDHGVEPPAERVAAGKEPVARVRLAAYHHGGQIVIEVADDGRGLDPAKILKKARQNGLVEEGVNPPEADIFNLIFEPGFSTAEKITDVSGRGVGMDVVRRNVQKLRGRIDIQSTLGQGTTFQLRFPLTLAIIDGLVVGVGTQRYIVPIFAVKEMFQPERDSISTVENRDEMAMVRGRLLPIVRLHERFGVQPRSRNPWEALLIVAESENRRFCLMVDELIGKQEVVIKSLGESLKNTPGVAGGAILGDGRVGLILEMNGVYGDGRAQREAACPQ